MPELVRSILIYLYEPVNSPLLFKPFGVVFLLLATRRLLTHPSFLMAIGRQNQLHHWCK